ncbi:MAG: sterol desaturase family protein [Bacteroidota bacterium]
MIGLAAIGLATFAAMEFVSYLVHRYVYHGFLWRVHRSHHTRREGPFELNDVFPLFFASVAIALAVAGFGNSDRSPLVAVAVGMTLYGAVYLLVHDLYIHRRIKALRLRLPFLVKIKRAHAVHHRDGAEPYGLLLPLRLSRLPAVGEHDEV